MRELREKIVAILVKIPTMDKEKMMLTLNKLKTEQQAEKYLNKLMDMTVGEMKQTDLIKMAKEI